MPRLRKNKRNSHRTKKKASGRATQNKRNSIAPNVSYPPLETIKKRVGMVDAEDLQGVADNKLKLSIKYLSNELRKGEALLETHITRSDQKKAEIIKSDIEKLNTAINLISDELNRREQAVTGSPITDPE